MAVTRGIERARSLIGVASLTAIACGPGLPTANTGEIGLSQTDTEAASCIPGEPECECNAGLCVGDLECVDGICMQPGDGDPGGVDPSDGDPGGVDPGDGDGDPGDGDPGDGDPGDGDGDTGDGDGEPDPCGNGIIDLGEDCDDGNNASSDGCNNDCTYSGTLQWLDVFPVFQQHDFAHGVAVDSNDQIFVSGRANMTDLDSNGWFRKYSPDGQLFWQQTLDGPGQTTSYDFCYHIAIDPSDDLILACAIDKGDDIDALIGKYDQNGTEIWTQQFDFGADHYDRAFSVAADSDGMIVVSGTGGGNGFVRRYDADGGLLWHRSYFFEKGSNHTRGRDVGYTADGNIAVAIQPGPRARLYTTDGDEIWTYESFFGEAVALGIDGNDVLLAGGNILEADSGWFGHLDADGEPLWEQTWAGDTYAYAYDITVDSMGQIVAVGQRQALDQTILATTRKYSADGQTLIWEQTLQGSKVPGSNFVGSVAIDSEDNIIVCGALAQETGMPNELDAFVAKYGP